MVSSALVYTPSNEPTRKLRVGFDARKLDSTGIGSYLRHLLHGFLASQEVEPVLFGDPVILKNEFPRVPHVPFLSRPNNPFAFNQIKNLEILKSLDLFHAPHYVGVQRLPIPLTTTIHDCIHISHPDKFYLPLIAAPLMRQALAASQGIIAVSEATQEELFKRFPKESQSKVKMVRPPLTSGAAAQLSKSPSHILCVVSTNKKHKGIADLLAAWKKVNSPLSLVLVGSGADSLKQYESETVRVLGKVSQSQLFDLYFNAGFVVIPSLVEGFGYVMAEAHRAGLFTVSRPVPALLEQKQDQDIFAENFSIPALVDALSKGIEKLQFGRMGVESLQKSAEAFLPARCARETYWAYIGCCS